MDPAWPYLQGIYEILHMIIVSPLVEVNVLKSFIKPPFVEEFLALFESEEPLERDILKNILHKMYAKLVPRRKMLRKHMNETLLSLIHEKDKFNGTAEILDILASIISGYAVPIRQEHLTFFESVLKPMHKV